MKDIVVIALGGNALQKANEMPTINNQLKNAVTTSNHLVEIIKSGYRVVITHGNGPQVGNIMLQNEISKAMVPPMPLDVCGAMTQGMIGYIMQQAMYNKIKNAGINKPVVTLVTQVEVDKNDKAFENPTKPVGPFYTKEEAEKLKTKKGYVVKEDSDRGWRRVVPSPLPQKIVEADIIKKFVNDDVIVITIGGGGIPVMKDAKGDYVGVEAVIDKDYASEKLAQELNADVLLILTAVDAVCLNYGKTDERKLRKVTATEMEKYIIEGHFADGSMLPKVEASIRFAKSKKGRKSIITSLDNAIQGLKEEAGTIITN
ncbi:MAG: carbamate kinase [Thermoanaerobacteraceae bacterium]|nr:carbamate kinase [Thermoanaerobacteraceae bacterium]